MPANYDDCSTGADKGTAAFPSAPELQHFAATYFSEAFPNPSRAGCPDEKVIVDAIEAGKLPSTGLRAHILACSACFATYGLALERKRGAAPSRKLWRYPPRLVMAFATVGFLVLGIAVGLKLFWPPSRSPVPLQVALNRPNALAPSLPMAAAPQTERVPHRKLSAALTLSVDLEAYATSRSVTSGSSNAPKEIRLPRATVRISLRLPEGRLPGAYTIRLLDEQERLLTVVRANSLDGDTLTVRLDTRQLPTSLVRLSLEHQGQAPLDYAVTIGPDPK